MFLIFMCLERLIKSSSQYLPLFFFLHEQKHTPTVKPFFSNSI